MTSQTILFVVGCFSLTFGTGATMYSRWNHAENARVHPVFGLFWLASHFLPWPVGNQGPRNGNEQLAGGRGPGLAGSRGTARRVKILLGGDTVSTEAVAARRHAGTHLPVTWWKLELPTTTWHLLLN
jgi:hypothetical protein